MVSIMDSKDSKTRRSKYKEELNEILVSTTSFGKWVLIALVCGLVVGLAGVAFSKSMAAATSARAAHPWLIFTLPLGGLLIVFIYNLFDNANDKGTNLILSSVQTGNAVPIKMAPCIFLGTIITHLCGGSAGREGAALQLGGSISAFLGKFIHLNEADTKMITMCGMSACFAALFGTPMAAAIFPLEVVTVGVLHYSALVPCVISSFVAAGIARHFGIHPEAFYVSYIPRFEFKSAAIVILLGCLCAFVSIAFCLCLHTAGSLFKWYFRKPYIRVLAGSAILIAMTLLVGNQRFNGAGVNFIEGFFETETVFPPDFILKMIFTAVTLGCGFKGGEIVPTMYIGAAFGTLFGMLTGFAPSLCTACGIVAVFCGVTNSPLSSFLIAFELFGFDGMPFYLLVTAVADRLSGYYSLYGSQQLMHAKINLEFADNKPH